MSNRVAMTTDCRPQSRARPIPPDSIWQSDSGELTIPPQRHRRNTMVAICHTTRALRFHATRWLRFVTQHELCDFTQPDGCDLLRNTSFAISRNTMVAICYATRALRFHATRWLRFVTHNVYDSSYNGMAAFRSALRFDNTTEWWQHHCDQHFICCHNV